LTKLDLPIRSRPQGAVVRWSHLRRILSDMFGLLPVPLRLSPSIDLALDDLMGVPRAISALLVVSLHLLQHGLFILPSTVLIFRVQNLRRPLELPFEGGRLFLFLENRVETSIRPRLLLLVLASVSAIGQELVHTKIVTHTTGSLLFLAALQELSEEYSQEHRDGLP